MQTSVSRSGNSRVPVAIRARRATAEDGEVGRRVRARRLEQRLSQTALADRIGVTFQQVQKYEKGVNRIGAGRLARIAEALEVPITFFFSEQPARTEKGKHNESVLGLVSTGGASRLLVAFHKIKSREAKQNLVQMAESLAAN